MKRRHKIILVAVITIVVGVSLVQPRLKLKASEEPWIIVIGQEYIHKLDVVFPSAQRKQMLTMMMYPLGQPQVYTLADNFEEIVVSAIPPDGTYTGNTLNSDVIKFNKNTITPELIPFEEFKNLNPHILLHSCKVFGRVPITEVPQFHPAGDVHLVDHAKPGLTVDQAKTNPRPYFPHIMTYPNKNKVRCPSDPSPCLPCSDNEPNYPPYAVALSVSDINIKQRQEYRCTESTFLFCPTAKKTVQYFSGTIHLEIFSLANPQVSIIHQKKQFRHWSNLPGISSFGHLCLMGKNEPCFLFYDNSPHTRGHYGIKYATLNLLILPNEEAIAPSQD